MYKLLKNKTLISLSIVLVSPITLATDINQRLLSCGQIESNTERLACFDSISTNLSSDNNLTAKDRPSSIQEKIIEPETKIIYADKPKPIELKDIEQTQDKKIASFGLPVERTSDEQQIKARLLGDIKRWDENSVFKLDNGQIWRAVRSNAKRRRSPVVLSNPEVTITRAVLGSFDLRIEGMQGRLKVKRLK